VTSATWKPLAGLRRADGTPTAPETSGNPADLVITQRELSENAQNDPIKFVQDFDRNDNITDINDAPDIPMQASEGDTPTDHRLPDAGTSLQG
jgi:hypothetical protein